MRLLKQKDDYALNKISEPLICIFMLVHYSKPITNYFSVCYFHLPASFF